MFAVSFIVSGQIIDCRGQGFDLRKHFIIMYDNHLVGVERFAYLTSSAYGTNFIITSIMFSCLLLQSIDNSIVRSLAIHAYEVFHRRIYLSLCMLCDKMLFDVLMA